MDNFIWGDWLALSSITWDVHQSGTQVNSGEGQRWIVARSRDDYLSHSSFDESLERFTADGRP